MVLSYNLVIYDERYMVNKVYYIIFEFHIIFIKEYHQRKCEEKADNDR